MADYSGIIQTSEVIEILNKYLINEVEEKEQILRTKEDFFKLSSEIKAKYGTYERILGELCFASDDSALKLKGHCSVCEDDTEFKVDTKDSGLIRGAEKRPLWREKLWCPKCRLNNRMRYMIGKVKNDYEPGMKVYMYEQITNSYKALKQFIPDLVGSEYLGEQYHSGDMVNEVRHEDAMELSFANESFDIILSQDVFEHVSDYEKAFKEMCRVLKPGKKAYITVPFATLNMEVERRAYVENGEIRHLMEPVYHGNPLSSEGSLVYNIFSWDLFDCLKECGFRDAYAVTYYSIKKGNLGILPFYIEAIK